MTEKDRDQIALFRYGLIAPILNGQVENQTEYLAEVCSKVHDVPYYGPREFAPKTISCWLLAYRKEGFEGLKPKRRSDKGSSRALSSEMEEHLLRLRREARDVPVSVFYENCWWKMGKSFLMKSPTPPFTASLKSMVLSEKDRLSRRRESVLLMIR